MGHARGRDPRRRAARRGRTAAITTLGSRAKASPPSCAGGPRGGSRTRSSASPSATPRGGCCTARTPPSTGARFPRIEGEGAIEFEVESIPFQRGRYYLTFAIHSRDHKTYHRLDNCRAVTVTPDGEHAGTVRLAGAVEVARVGWRVAPEAGALARRVRAAARAGRSSLPLPASVAAPQPRLRDRDLRPRERRPGRAARVRLRVRERRGRRPAHPRGGADLRLHDGAALGAAAARPASAAPSASCSTRTDFAGEVVKEVEVRSNDPPARASRCGCKALVEPEIDFEPRVVAFDDVRPARRRVRS